MKKSNGNGSRGTLYNAVGIGTKSPIGNNPYRNGVRKGRDHVDVPIGSVCW